MCRHLHSVRMDQKANLELMLRSCRGTNEFIGISPIWLGPLNPSVIVTHPDAGAPRKSLFNVDINMCVFCAVRALLTADYAVAPKSNLRTKLPFFCWLF